MEDAVHVGEEEDPLGAEADGERRRRLVGVHVQRPAGERRDDRHEPEGERVLDGRGPRGQRAADEAQIGHRLRLEPDLVAGEADGLRPDRSAHRRVDGGEALAHDRERLRRGDAAAADELHGEAAPLHLRGNLRAGSVDDADAPAVRPQLVDGVRRAGRRRAPDLQHDGHERYSALMRT